MMTPTLSKLNRILAIDPSPRGFGFVVMEHPEKLIDWGLKEAKISQDGQDNRHAHSLRQIASLVERYEPDLIAVEDIAHGSRRGHRASNLILSIHELGQERNIPTRAVTKPAMRRAFSASGAALKEEIARTLAERFPELALRLPPPRKPWTGTDPRMALFSAVAMAVTSLNHAHGSGKK